MQRRLYSPTTACLRLVIPCASTVRRYDQDKNGFIDVAELVPLLREMGFKAMPEEVAHWLRQVCAECEAHMCSCRWAHACVHVRAPVPVPGGHLEVALSVTGSKR